jgi:hypothetical protein
MQRRAGGSRRRVVEGVCESDEKLFGQKAAAKNGMRVRMAARMIAGLYMLIQSKRLAMESCWESFDSGCSDFGADEIVGIVILGEYFL